VSVDVDSRGGGDFQNLLPFSDETLLRRGSERRIPIVSAIGL
jgi:Exonuclease VII, large subunit